MFYSLKGGAFLALSYELFHMLAENCLTVLTLLTDFKPVRFMHRVEILGCIVYNDVLLVPNPFGMSI